MVNAKPPPARSLFAPIWRAARDSIELVRDAECATDWHPRAVTTATASSAGGLHMAAAAHIACDA